MTAYLLRHVLVSNALVSEFCGALLKRPVNALTNRLHCWKRRATESRWSYFPVDTLVNPESLQTPLLTVPKHLKARTKSIKVTMWRQVCVCPVVEPVASQLSCCAAEASALVDRSSVWEHTPCRRGHAAGCLPKQPQLQWLIRMTASLPHAL